AAAVRPWAAVHPPRAAAVRPWAAVHPPRAAAVRPWAAVHPPRAAAVRPWAAVHPPRAAAVRPWAAVHPPRVAAVRPWAAVHRSPSLSLVKPMRGCLRAFLRRGVLEAVHPRRVDACNGSGFLYRDTGELCRQEIMRPREG